MQTNPEAETFSKLVEENQELRNQLEEQRRLVIDLSADRDEKQREIDRLKFFIERIENDRKPLENELEESERKRTVCKQVIAKYLRLLQELHNKEKKAMIANQSVRLGQLIYKRIGSQFKHVWEDGDELIQLKSQLEEIIKEKEGLEKIRRSKKSRRIIKEATNPNNSLDKEAVDTLFDFSNSIELSRSLSKIEETEEKEFLTLKISMKQKEETRLRERLELIKKEKIVLSQEMKRQNDELNSTL